jgi:FixJ family two-component response regulator
MQSLAKAQIPLILMIGLSDEECSPIRAGAKGSGWRTQEVRGYREAILQLCREKAPVIVCNSKLPDGAWEDVLGATATQTVRPRIIVVSRQADERLWADVLNSGGFDVLASPYVERDVRRCIELACRNWWDEVRQEDWRRAAAAVGA